MNQFLDKKRIGLVIEKMSHSLITAWKVARRAKNWQLKTSRWKLPKINPKPLVLLLVAGLILFNVWPEGAHAGYSFQTNYNSGSYDAFSSLGSPTAATDTALPALNPAGKDGTNSLSYSYDGTSTLKYPTASNLPVAKGSISMDFQKSAYGNNVNQDAGSMYNPGGVAIDSSVDVNNPDIYISDITNNRIIKTKMDGTGWQTFGHYGTGGIGQFNQPRGLKYSSGYLYVADYGNNRIVKTKMDGNGWQTLGQDGGGNYQFRKPTGLDFDSVTGRLYVYDSCNSRVAETNIEGTYWRTVAISGNNWCDNLYPDKWARSVSYDHSSGYVYIGKGYSGGITITKMDGTGSSSFGTTAAVSDVYYDSANTVIYATMYDGTITKFSTSGTVLGTKSGFNVPSALVMDATTQNFYVTNYSGNNIVKTQFDGTGWTAYGSYSKNLMKMNYPSGSFYDSSSGYFYMSDSSNNRIVKTKIDGTGWTTLGGFNGPRGIFYDSSTGYIYVSNSGANNIVKTQFDGTGWTTLGGFNQPHGLSYDSYTGYIYVAGQTNNGSIIKTKIDGTGWAVYGTSGSGVGNFSYPRGVFYDSSSDPSHNGTGFLYVADSNNNRIVKTGWGSIGWTAYGTSGTGVGQFNIANSGGIWYDSSTQNIYVADSGNRRIVRFANSMDGTGWAGYGTSGTGVGQFNSSSIQSIQYDPTTGYIYVSDGGNNRIVRTQIDGTGWQTTNDFTAKEKVLFSAQATDDMRIVYDVMSRKIRFYLAYSNKAQFIETPTLNLTDGQWYTLKANFNKANHTISLDLDGSEVATITYDTDWGDLSFGSYFYIGARNGSTTDRWDGMIDNINVDIDAIDTTAPTNPTLANTHFYSDSGKTTEFTTDDWGNSATPYITFSGASDTESGLKGYWLYFGTDIAATPTTTSGVLTPNPGYSRLFQTHVGAAGAEQNITVPATALTSGVTYYLRARTQDNDLNMADAVTLFTYKYDGGAPAAPEYVNVSPVGCSTANTFTFTWPAITDPVSGIAGYQYKNGSGGAVTDAGDVITLDLAPYQEGDNVLYLRAKDNAGNVSPWQTAVFCSTGVAYIIDGPTVTAGPSSINVAWVSSKTTTSYVQVYQGNEYVSEQGHTDYSISHDVVVVGLDPETDYRYKLRWLDQSGNPGESAWYQTATSVAPYVGDFKSEIITPSKVLLSWKSSEDASAVLSYGVGTAGTSIDIGGSASTFSQTVDGLQGGTNYVVRIKSTTQSDSYVFYSDYYSFETPPMPEITGLTFEPVAGKVPSAMKVEWNTNVDTTSTVYYGESGGSKTEISQNEKLSKHEIEIDNLNDSTSYEVYAAGTDQYGNEAKSDTNTFTTPLDTTPPVISDLTIETSNVGLGKEDKAQIAVSWVTNKAATSQVEYGEGVSGDQYSNKTSEDKALATQHLVIISDLTPSTPYHLHAVSVDKNGNIGKSDDSTAIPGEVQKSILQIILQTLQNVFGWIGRL